MADIDLFDAPKQAKMEKKITENKSEEILKRLNNKDVGSWNCNDMLSYLHQLVHEKFNHWLPMLSIAKDRRLMKSLIDAYSAPVVKKEVEYLVENWEALPYDGFPCVSILYGFRNKLIAECQGLTKQKKSHREWRGKKTDEAKVGEW